MDNNRESNENKKLRAAAERGDAEAQFQLARLFESDPESISPITIAESIQLYHKAAAQGHIEAQYELGCYYAHSKFMQPEMNEAFGWFEQAANKGHAKAQYELGKCYAAGDGVERDQVIALDWYRRAAKQRHEAAEYQIGCCYVNGQGVTKDLVNAQTWFRSAAKHGYVLAVCRA
jgi:TPR repeat protein